MKLLLVHSDSIEYEATKKALKSAPELEEGQQSGRLEEAICAFITVEAEDEANLQSACKKAAHEIRQVGEQLKVQNLMLYPYAHLSSSLAKPSVGAQALPMLEEMLTGDFEVVKRSPFGWYKAFNLKVKGHPLSELSRHVLPDVDDCCDGHETEEKKDDETEGNAALKAEKNLKSAWYILDLDGKLTPADEFNFKGHNELKQFYEYEAKGTRKADKPPAHIQLMQNLELVDYEPGSDTGNMRWFPKGQLIKRLLEDKVNALCRDAGGMQIETPIMYDVNHPALNKYLNKFPARQYRIKSDDKELFLRFAACFGMYLTMGRSTLSYRHLPARIYELTHYSFRREQSGETSGIKRLRAFTMPDMHTLVADQAQARDEFTSQFALSKGWMDSIQVPYETAIRFVRGFYEENREFAANLVKTVGRPCLIEMWEEQNFYFVMKFEFNVNDSTKKAFALSTVQIDTQNPKHFDIEYTGQDGERHTPYLLHASLSGAVDRNLCAILESEAMKRDAGGKPSLPYWLSPTQVRFLPVSDAHLDHALDLAAQFNNQGIRADVDDESAGIGKKIRTAEKDWIPFIVVVGDNEIESGNYQVRVRTAELAAQAEIRLEEGQRLDKVEFTQDALQNACWTAQGDEPWAGLSLPVCTTARPVFRG